jgi:hypothetical protein
MAKAYQTNSMPTMKGMTPGVNAYGQIPNMAYTPRLVAKVAAYTVLASESGTVFTNFGATTAVTFTLPAITDGPYQFWFLAMADFAITVASAAVDTILSFNDIDLDDVQAAQSGEIIGASIEVICDGTTLFVLPRLANEAQTYVFTD